MRKFRGKREDNGDWVEGFCGQFTKYDAMIIDRPYQSMCGLAAMNFWMVDPETVCQYTGLKDKNGNRKYEGDIFQADDGDFIQKFVIQWNNDLLEWSAECIGDPEGTISLCEFNVNEIDVIGNIFDNPELIRLVGKDSGQEVSQPGLMPAT